jgi:uncharacterized protein with FMN-binding domain
VKRTPLVIGVTAAGLAGILTFHTHGTTVPLGASRSGGAGSSSPGPHAAAPRAASTGPPAPSSQTASAIGTLEQYGYGQLSVRVTVTAGRIADVAVATLQTADTYSRQLADEVIPALRREVLTAQSARIDAMSGATYTSDAYASSVQSALDQLHP